MDTSKEWTPVDSQEECELHTDTENGQYMNQGNRKWYQRTQNYSQLH